MLSGQQTRFQGHTASDSVGQDVDSQFKAGVRGMAADFDIFLELVRSEWYFKLGCFVSRHTLHRTSKKFKAALYTSTTTWPSVG